MQTTRNAKVQQFLEGLQAADAIMYNIINECRNLIFDVYPTAEEKMMYGGIIFYEGKDMMSGVFAYKKHVSMEFSNGYLMNDDYNLLEGKGKFRRHIKLEKQVDIEGKKLKFYVRQAKKS